MSAEVISLRQLSKNFGTTLALDSFDLTVQTGEIHGFLGPNGAGKSTAIRVLLGQLKADSGSARMFGEECWQNPALHHRLAYVPGDVSLWPNLTGGEIIDFLLRLRGVDPARSSRDSLIERFDLNPRKRSRSYSKGSRQKVALIAALSAPVDLLLLDEPTSGLDPLMEGTFNECIQEAKRAGTTVLLSSHILSEVDKLADHVTIIRGGQQIQSGPLAQMRHLNRFRVTIEFVGDPPSLSGIPDVSEVVLTTQANTHVVSFRVGATSMDTVVKAFSHLAVLSLTSTLPTLEEVFMDAYRGPQ